MPSSPSTSSFIPTGTTGVFINKLSDWKFNIPSKHLWTVNIFLHNDGSEGNLSLSKLFQNIDKVNKTYNAQLGTPWAVKSNTSQSFVNDYIAKLEVDQTAMFLACGVGYGTHKANVNEQVANTLLPRAGFITFDYISNGKTAAHDLNIQFMETNWNIADILFEKWIAAYIQQGGIEDSNLPNIKADIYINEYAAGVPKDLRRTNEQQWQLRKTLTFTKCVPISRNGNDTKLTMSHLSAPNIVTVNFKCLDYTIQYWS